jgi:hypothetical protein
MVHEPTGAEGLGVACVAGCSHRRGALFGRLVETLRASEEADEPVRIHA